MEPATHSNAEMKGVFSQINVAKLKLRNGMSAEPANAILNIRTGLKRDNIIKHFMIMTEIPEAVTMYCFIGTSLVCMKTIQLKVVLIKIILAIFKFAYFHHYAFFFCVFISASVWFILCFFRLI